MPQNPQQTMVINPILSTHALGYKQAGFVGHVLFPNVPVFASAGQTLEFGKEHFMMFATIRTPGAVSKRIDFGYLGKPYVLENHSIEVPMPIERMRDARAVPGLDLGRRATNLGMKTIALPLEKQRADIATNAANYDAANKIALVGTAKWSDRSANSPSDPTGDVDTGKEAIRQKTGMRPNVAVLSPIAFKAAKTHPKVLEAFKYKGDGLTVTTEMLAELWELDVVIVGEAISANAAGDFTDLWANNVVLAYVATSSEGDEEPSYGYTYNMNGHPAIEEPYFEKQSKSWVYSVAHERMPVLTGMAAGYLIQNPD